MREGFFKFGNNITQQSLKSINKQGSCEECGLYKNCVTPKMDYTGKGKKGILIVLESPSQKDDALEKHISGTEETLLETIFDANDLNLYEDCYITHAVSCFCKNVTEKELNSCRSRLLKTISDLNPKIIIPLGLKALQGLISHKIEGRFSLNYLPSLYGCQIPDQKWLKWIVPNYSPSYLVEHIDYKTGGIDNALLKLFTLNLEKAFELLDEEIPTYSIENIEKITEKIEAIKIMKHIENNWDIVAFDFETTGIKPHAKGHKIACVSFSNGKETYSCLWFETSEFYQAFRDLMNSKIKKICQKLDYEDNWSYFIANSEVNNWYWDTNLAAHVIHNQNNTGLKLLAYSYFGHMGYDNDIDKYLKSDIKNLGTNSINNVFKAPVSKLLKYCGQDSLLTYWIHEKQKEVLVGRRLEGYEFFLDGQVTLADIQKNGICFNEEKAKETTEHLTKRINSFYKKIMESEEAKLFLQKEKKVFDPNSSKDIQTLLYDHLGIKIKNLTEKGNASTDVNTLENIKIPVIKTILEYRKDLKIRDTFIRQALLESVDGIIRPFFNLASGGDRDDSKGGAKSFRSSSSNINFQNQPKRDKRAMQLIRELFIPREGHKIVEYDYKSLEVCIAACVYQDPLLIKYVTDPTTDMHRDTAIGLFCRDENTWTKQERFAAKNGYVFPAFYGSSGKNSAKGTWEHLTKDTKDNLKEKKGIRNLQDFTEWVQNYDKIFWGERFKVYDQKRKEMWEEYQRKGYLMTKTGFKLCGPMSFTNVVNYPVQSVAFHCLLWSLININKEIKGFRSKIIGQIHDAIVLDVHPSEEEEIDRIVRKWGEEEVRKHWDWIIVPLKLEKSSAGIDEDWSMVKD